MCGTGISPGRHHAAWYVSPFELHRSTSRPRARAGIYQSMIVSNPKISTMNATIGRWSSRRLRFLSRTPRYLTAPLNLLLERLAMNCTRALGA